MALTFDSQYVFYVDFTKIGSTTVNELCNITQNFNYSELINKADQYIIAVERFNIPISTVAMQINQDAFLTLQDVGGGNEFIFNLADTFSLLEFLQQLNDFHTGLIFSLTSDLRVSISYDWVTQELVLSENAQCIFDMPPIIGTTVVVQAPIRGGSPIPDHFDRLIEVELISGESLLQQQQEIQSSQVLRFKLTDFLIPNPFSTSFAFEEGTIPTGAFNVSYPVRQSLQFFAGNNKRPIMLKGKSPIQNISVRALAVVRTPTGELDREEIRIAPCGYYNVKLGFYLKGAIGGN